MKNISRVLNQAWLMLIVLFGFSDVTSESEMNKDENHLVLSKPVKEGSELYMQLQSPDGNPDQRTRVSIFNPTKFKGVFIWFKNAYDAAKYIGDGLCATELYESYMRVCREDGPFDLELQKYYAMITAGTKKEFLTVDAVNSSDATEQIKDKIVNLFKYYATDHVDVKIMNSSDAKLFAGFIIAN